jgi:tetratricopeptide (TPR) repeat protein
MRMLLKAMGFWIWGLIAISLSVSLVTVSYRLASSYRRHTSPAVSEPITTTDFKTSAKPVAGPVSKEASPADTLPKGAKLSRVIAKEMTAAHHALQDRRWNEALDNLSAAQSKSPLTAFDLKTIYEFRAFAYVRINNLKAAQAAYESELATGIPTTDETVNVFRTLFRIAASNQQYSTAVDYGKKLADLGVIGTDDLALMSQLFYLDRDCKGSAIWGDKAIAAMREAGEPPKENLYQFKLQCASAAGDTPGMTAAAADLIRLTGKSSYWNTFLRIERQDERDDHNLLMIYRLMYDTKSMNVGTDYIEMAQLLGNAGLPGEALTVLQKALAAGFVTDSQKERTSRLMENMRARVDSAESPRNEMLGEVYFGLGDYQMAVDFIADALDKHTVKHWDDAYVYMGRADIALKDTAAARSAFGQLMAVPNVSPRVSRIWSLYAETLGHPLPERAAE